MINDCTPEPSIIKDYTKMTDNQLQVLVDNEYEDAILELARREGKILLCEMPNGTWAATCEGIIANGFSSKDEARNWVKERLKKTGWVQQKKNTNSQF